MDRANTNPAGNADAGEKQPEQRSIIIPSVLLAALVAVALLWIRFGNSVFAASLMDGLIACF
jgi:hypothetical protein